MPEIEFEPVVSELLEEKKGLIMDKAIKIMDELERGKPVIMIDEIKVYIKVPITDFELGLWHRFYEPLKVMIMKDIATAVATYLTYEDTAKAAKAAKWIVVTIPSQFDLRFYESGSDTPVVNIGEQYKVTISNVSKGSIFNLLYITTRDTYKVDGFDPSTGSLVKRAKNVKDRVYLVRGINLQDGQNFTQIDSYIDFIFPMVGNRVGEIIYPRYARLPNGAIVFRRPYISVGPTELYIKGRALADITSLDIYVSPWPALIIMVTRGEEVVSLGGEIQVG